MTISDLDYMERRDTFLAASRYIQATYTAKEINRRWNATGIGHGAIQNTTDRWMKLGPRTKNVYFEPWIIEWAAHDLTQVKHNYRKILNVQTPNRHIMHALDNERASGNSN